MVIYVGQITIFNTICKLCSLLFFNSTCIPSFENDGRSGSTINPYKLIQPTGNQMLKWHSELSKYLLYAYLSMCNYIQVSSNGGPPLLLR